MIDRLAFDYQVSNRELDENGYLHVSNCNITKECVNPYLGREIPGYEELGLDPEKIYYGYRKGDELKKAIKKFNGIPLLNKHIVDSAEEPRLEDRCGALGTDAKWEAPYVVNSLIVYNKDDIDDIEADVKKELSSAYRYKPVFNPGEFNGEHYDFIMTNIRPNHVALVKEGRAGSDVVVADSNINIINKLKKDKMAETKEALDDVVLKSENKEIPVNKLLEGEFKEDEHQDDIKQEQANDEDVDKNHLEDEIIAIALKADTDFKGGREEKDATLRKLLTKGMYSPSTKDKSTDDSCFNKDENIEKDKIEEDDKKEDEKKIEEDGGLGSGDFSHQGRPGKVGGSAESGKGREGAEKRRKEVIGAAKDTAMDGAIQLGREQVKQEMRELSNAVKSVKSLIGEVDMFAFDSAYDVYKLAIENAGLNPKDYDKSAYKGIVDVLNLKNSSKNFAMDSKIEEEPEYLKKANNFKRG